MGHGLTVEDPELTSRTPHIEADRHGCRSAGCRLQNVSAPDPGPVSGPKTRRVAHLMHERFDEGQNRLEAYMAEKRRRGDETG